MLLLLTMAILSAVLTSLASTYPIFLIGIWGSGFASIGYGTVMYCWMMELLAGEKDNLITNQLLIG